MTRAQEWAIHAWVLPADPASSARPGGPGRLGWKRPANLQGSQHSLRRRRGRDSDAHRRGSSASSSTAFPGETLENQHSSRATLWGTSSWKLRFSFWLYFQSTFSPVSLSKEPPPPPPRIPASKRSLGKLLQLTRLHRAAPWKEHCGCRLKGSVSEGDASPQLAVGENFSGHGLMQTKLELPEANNSIQSLADAWLNEGF